ncbi:hypothetical protein CJ030_MR3G001293 [Morella rubra]|uniref:Uncharacterized protein n=1 Tax=Morella rubra TaxID=262757 RepID=A0A6A1W1V2_9ROSI|nr:hypothetical protein CJ030_MR3G001293 [Morella rubra]
MASSVVKTISCATDITVGTRRICWRCNSGNRAVGAESPSQGADNDLPSPVTVSPRTTQSSSASTSGIKQVQDKTRGIALEKAHIAGKLCVHILDNRIGGDNKDDFNLNYDRLED